MTVYILGKPIKLIRQNDIPKVGKTFASFWHTKCSWSLSNDTWNFSKVGNKYSFDVAQSIEVQVRAEDLP